MKNIFMLYYPSPKGLKISFNSEALKAAHDYDCWLLNIQSGQVITYDKEIKKGN